MPAESETTIHLHTRHQIGTVDPRIFGGFLEHMGRAVYEGVYDPESPLADADGWRSDVLEKLAGLAMPLMRYPGGNFASGYHWEDGVGPREQRPRVRELAWNSIEPNHVGTDEFMKLARRMGWQPMFTVNLGTGTPEEARNWVEYCNAPVGTRYADMRAHNGHPEPYANKLWCLGNEMDGPWQLGHVPAAEYARRAQQSAKMMKDLDPTLEFVVCGSSNPDLNSFLAWDQEVLEIVGPLADYVSLHAYVGNRTDTFDYLATGARIDRQIEQVDAVCRVVQGRRRDSRRTYLSFDEWNVWYKTMAPEHMNGAGKFAPPLIEEVFNLEDALVVAGFLHSFLRHADVVKIANLAQVVNIIAPLLTTRDGVLVQSIYWPFAMMSRRRDGTSLRVAIDGPRYQTVTHGEVTRVEASAILGNGRLELFMTNRSDAPSLVSLHVADAEITGLDTGELLHASDPKLANTWDEPEQLVPEPLPAPKLAQGIATFELPPFAFAAATLRLD